MAHTIWANGKLRNATAEEEASINADRLSSSDLIEKKLLRIKKIRKHKLQETDFYALSDVTMSSEMSTYRQALRDIPQDYTTEDEYDLLLARNEQGQLTHTVWEKP